MHLMKRLLIGACPIALCLMPVYAQSTGSAEIETVTVIGARSSLGGIKSFEPVAKQMSVITSDFLETQTAGQTVFDSLNMLPGYNFTNNDPYGTSGGNFRMHGQDGAHVSVTLDGMPLNDTGNYAMYTNQMLDTEVATQVSMNQGTTDVDSPTAAVTGGSIAIRSDNPNEDFGALANISAGDDRYQRYAFRLDTGKFGPWGTTAFATASYSDYDKFKGPGMLRKKQINLEIYQDVGTIGWIKLAAHFNQNRNNQYTNYSYTGKGGIDKTKWNDSNDYNASCTPVAAVAGTAQAADSCSYWYKLRINPSDTGNVRMASLWHLTKDLTLTADGSLQYTLANGGGSSTLSEHSGMTVGSTGNYAKTASKATTTAYGCISGANGGCDLNGDGDILDTVRVYTPSNTNTRRWGFNTSLIYAPLPGQTFRAAYTLDYGVHRQTGQYSRIGANGPYSVWSGWDDDAHKVVAADGTDIRKRDRNSRAVLQQVSFDYQGSFLGDTVLPSLGFRLPFLHRGLDNSCYTQIGSYNVLCTTEAPSAVASNGIVSFASTSTQYVAPEKANKSWNKFLPHLGVSFYPLGKEHQFFVNYTQELAAPRTDYLYSSTGTIYTGGTISQYTAYENVKPETSTSYNLGYRYLGQDIDGTVVLWNNQVKNRIVTSWDEEQSISTERNIPGVNYAGVDADFDYKPTEDLTLYGSASYTSARITVDIPINGTVYAQTKGKQMSEVPNWTFTGRVSYDLPVGLKIGMGGKYVGRRYASDDNNIRVTDYYTVDADLSYDLDKIGMKGSSIRLNVDNILNKHAYGSISSTTCYDGRSGCTTAAYVNASPLRTVSLTLSAKY